MLRNLKSEMLRQNITLKQLADRMEISRNGLSLKVNEHAAFTVAERHYIADLLGVGEDGIDELFASDRRVS